MLKFTIITQTNEATRLKKDCCRREFKVKHLLES